MQKRITIFDTVRGFTMLSMAGFHACYDLAYLYGWDMPWFTETVFQDIWRASISWVFLFIAGWMCTLSRNNVMRALKYAAAALIVWIATTLVSVDDSVNFASFIAWRRAPRWLYSAVRCSKNYRARGASRRALFFLP